MGSHSEVALADEALKALFDRFKANQSSELSRELSEALLARGHANEALHVTELGIQSKPDDPEVRIQRAAALIALGRPRVAYVELLRALAIEPHHHRGMRLLGRVFVEAGAPERAAKLLAKRLGAKPTDATADRVKVQLDEDPKAKDGDASRPEPARSEPIKTEPIRPESIRPESIKPEAKSDKPKLDAPKTKLEAPHFTRAPDLTAGLVEAATVPEAPRLDAPRVPLGGGLRLDLEISKTKPDLASPVSQLFAALTSDLGLTPAEPVRSRVQVTQVVRTRKKSGERDDFSTKSLSEIDGPIVDRTQPGELEIDRDAPGLPPMPPPPATLLDVVTSPQFSISNIDDEPLFNEAMPFEVRPVDSRLEDSNDTIEEAIPAGLDVEALRAAMETPEEKADDAFPSFSEKQPSPIREIEPLVPLGRAETPVPPVAPPAASEPPPPETNAETSPLELEPAYLKRFKRSGRTAPQIDLPESGSSDEPSEQRQRPVVLIAIVVALLVLGLLWISRDFIRSLLGG
ncbi:MAG: hypothetical protein HY791_27970 [Deltaproteobacteria bacterium]|nr:hypothetical protein [Deltaproteobacteria bacterium]